MWPFDSIGSTLGGELKTMVASGFEAAMEAIWKVSLWWMAETFKLVDKFSAFTVSTDTGPISVLWPVMLWISGILALGLFFWQLAGTVLRGGRGFVRLIVGPMQYGVALAVSVGLISALLAGADGITEGILDYGLQAENFTDALDATGFLDANADGVHAIALGFFAFTGVLPASLGYALEMLFREAAIYVLVAAIPLNAAGLLSGTAVIFFWRTARWLVVCVLMKPMLGLTLVLGVSISGGSTGFTGMLAGIGVLMISLGCPFVLFRLFAFIDPSTDAGAAFRDNLASRGYDSYGDNNPGALASNLVSRAFGGGGGGGDGGGSAETEDANTSRFDEAEASFANEEMNNSGTGTPSGGGSSARTASASTDRDSGDGSGSGAEPGTAPSSGSSTASDPGTDPPTPPPANRGSVVSSAPDLGSSGSYDAAGDGGSGAGGASKGKAAGAEEAAVIV